MRDMPAPFRGATRDAMPFYIVCDISSSMWDEEYADTWDDGVSPWQRMTQELNKLLEHLEEHDDSRDVAHVSVVEFADRASVKLELTKISDGPNLDALSKGTWTNFVGVWQLLSEVVVRDIQQLREDRYRPFRPTIFFITDANPGSVGRPQTRDDWGKPYDELFASLQGLNIAPRVVSIGFGSVDDEVLLQLHSENPHGAAIKFSHVGGTNEIIGKFIEQMRKSIQNSAVSGNFIFDVPAGMESLCSRSHH